MDHTREYYDTILDRLSVQDKYQKKLEKLVKTRERRLKKWEEDETKSRAEMRQLINLFNKREKELIMKKEKKAFEVMDQWHKAHQDLLDTIAESDMQAKYAEKGTPLKELKKAYVSRMRTQERRQNYNKARRAATQKMRAVRKSTKASSPKSPKQSRSPMVASAD
jgi:hypothetical protein